MANWKTVLQYMCPVCGNMQNEHTPHCCRCSSPVTVEENNMDEWQKVLVNKLIEQVGLTHTDAMKVMGIVCDVHHVAYMEGYDRGWSAAAKQGKPTAQPTTAAAQNTADTTDCLLRCQWRF